MLWVSGRQGLRTLDRLNAIQNAVTNAAVNISVHAGDPRVGLVNHTGVLRGVTGGQTATFDIEFIGDGFASGSTK